MILLWLHAAPAVGGALIHALRPLSSQLFMKCRPEDEASITKYRQASPIHHLPNRVPLILAVGTKDTDVPMSMVRLGNGTAVRRLAPPTCAVSPTFTPTRPRSHPKLLLCFCSKVKDFSDAVAASGGAPCELLLFEGVRLLAFSADPWGRVRLPDSHLGIMLSSPFSAPVRLTGRPLHAHERRHGRVASAARAHGRAVAIAAVSQQSRSSFRVMLNPATAKLSPSKSAKDQRLFGPTICEQGKRIFLHHGCRSGKLRPPHTDFPPPPSPRERRAVVE